MSLLKLKNRLKTVKGLNEIFTALQVVTVVRLQKAKERHAAATSYLPPIEKILSGRIAEVKPDKKALVVVTSNRGLCGSFNNDVIEKASGFIDENPGTMIVLFGKRSVEAFRKKPGCAGDIAIIETDAAEKADFNRVSLFIRKVLELNADVNVAYNKYKSAMVQVPVIQKLFPVPDGLAVSESEQDIILEPSRDELTDRLFRHYLEASFFKIVSDSQVGELSARLMLLKGAVDSSKDIISSLTMSINKARQAAITKDLLEIVSAAEALRR